MDDPGDGREDDQSEQYPRFEQVRGPGGPDEIENDQDFEDDADPAVDPPDRADSHREPRRPHETGR